MNRNLTEKIANYFILILFLILLSLVGYNVYIIFNKITTPKKIPRNSIRVSPISGELLNVSSPISITKVKYNDDNLDLLGSIDKASIVFESYSKGENKLNYSALFDSFSFSLSSSMEIIIYQSEDSIPKFNFVPHSTLKENNFYNEASVINIVQSLDTSYSLLYYDGVYHRFDKAIEASTLNNTPLIFDNIIICKNEETYLFTKGLFKKISSNEELTLSQGKTYYITLSSNGNFSTEN